MRQAMWASTALVMMIGRGSLARADDHAETPTVMEAPVKTTAAAIQSLNKVVHGYGTATFGVEAVRNVNFPRPIQLSMLFVSVGQEVREGQKLLGYATDASAKMVYQQAMLAAQAAKDELQRTETLFAKQLSTNAQVAAARKNYQDSQTTLAAQKALGGGGSASVYVSPFDGVVTAILAAQGDRLAAGAPLLQIAPRQSTRLVLGIEPKDAAKIRPGMAVKITGILDDSARAEGKVTTVSGLINPQTQLVDVSVGLSSGVLLGGSKVGADIVIDTIKGTAVPRAAVLSGDQGDYIVLVKEGVAKRQAVSIAVEDGDLVGISESLPADSKVVLKGHYALEDGMHVVEESAP